MKRNILSLAVAASVAGGVVSTANAMYVNEKGLGEALVYPFYSAANGNDTYISVVNTTNRTKAVKVRFIEALDSQEVLDFNLYLSPEDVWAGVITANPNGTGAIIRTADTSCTVPELGTAGGANVGELAGTQTDISGGRTLRDQPFVPFNFRTGDTVTGNERTLEGYIEVFEMGQLDPTTGFGADAVHGIVEGGPATPADCGALVDAWTTGVPGPTGGEWLVNNVDDFDTTWVGGGLYGYGVVINPADGTAAGYDAVAVADYFDPNNGIGAYHSAPGTVFPNFQQSNTLVTIFDGAMPVAMDFTGLSGDAALDALDAASTLFMTLNVANDYVIDPDINALTDWVLTMPTKQAYTAPQTIVPPATTQPPAREPFTNRWTGTAACEPIAIQSWDREESPSVTPPGGPVFSPQPPGPPPAADFAICTEMSVISFGGESALKASDNVLYGFTPDANEGWARLSFDPADTNTTADDATRVLTDGTTTVTGLPAVGFAVFKYQNTALGGSAGVVANYAAAVEHKAVVSVQ